jgi:hypothetical protein
MCIENAHSPSQLTSCTPTNCNFYSDNPFDTYTSERAFQVYNLIHIQSLRSFIQSIRPRPRLFQHFGKTLICCGERLLASLPTPKLEDRRLSFVRGSYPPYMEAVPPSASVLVFCKGSTAVTTLYIYHLL